VWLNDEVVRILILLKIFIHLSFSKFLLESFQIINFYLQLLQDNYPSTFAFSTFFISKYYQEGYVHVRNWTKKVFD